jgi:manganese/iron transport system substrate-binding protein
LCDNDYHCCNLALEMSTKINLSFILRFGIAAIFTTLTACYSTPEAIKSTNSGSNRIPNTENLPQVVATTTVICGLTKQIAADTINLKCLVDAGFDPHVYEPKPDDRKAIESAKLVLYAGYNFEPSLIKLIADTSNPAPKIAVNEIAVPAPQKFADEGQTIADPHVWHDAKNGIEIAKTISKNLSALKPDRAETYTKNTAKIVTELEQLDPWIKAQIATIPKASRKLVTTHGALGYYSKAYNILLEGALSGISTEEQPTAARIKELVKIVKDAKVSTIFAEVSLNPKLITAVAKEAGVKVSERELFTDGLGEKGSKGETYTDMLSSNTRTIVEGLGGNYAPFQVK